MRRIALLLVVAGRGFAQYSGAETCAPCHAARVKEQSASEHARALHRVDGQKPAAIFGKAETSVKDTNSVYGMVESASGTAAHVTAGKTDHTVPIEWAFGAGDQATTYVSQLDEDAYLEHRFSLYSRAGALGLTPGHRAAQPATWPEAAGVVYKTFSPEAEVLRCFQCHSTGKLTLGSKMNIVPAELGVRCEACHGPGAAHVKAMQRADVAGGRRAIQNPGRLAKAALNDFCGNCHRMPVRGESGTNWRDPWNVRHQPIYLAQSACFRKSNGAFSCLTCHDPHQPLRRRDPAFYIEKCRACHEEAKHPAVARTGSQNCISCHMPGVAPREYLAFTNHWIGVYRKGENLKPVSRH